MYLSSIEPSRQWWRAGLKLLWVAYMLLTSFYCLLAYLPYTYYALIKAPPTESIPWFASHHVLLYWLLLLCTAGMNWRRRNKKSVILLAMLFVAGVLLIFHPVLAHLRSDTVAYVWSLVALAPLALLALVEIVNMWPEDRWLSQFSITFFPFVISAIVIALLTSLETQVAYYAAHHSISFDWKSVDLALWSLVSHVVLAILVVFGLNLLFLLSARTPYPRLVGIATIVVTTSVVLGAGLANFLHSAFSLSGAPSILYAGLLATSLVAQVCALQMSWHAHQRTSAPPAIRNRDRKLIWIAAFAGLAVLTLMLPLFVGDWDWNSIVERLNALLLWVVLPFGFCRILQRPRTYSVPALFAVMIIAGSTYKTLQWTEFVWARPLGLIDQDVTASMERYASEDISFQLTDRLLGNASAKEECGELCRVLRQYTNIRDAETTASVNLVENLTPIKTDRPNIFIFVIDSLRPDFLGPYNPNVDFTPNIDSLAKDSTVFRDAYTQYAGTTLSEPAIWSGALLLHSHYLHPFESVNSLEKLVKTDGYQMVVSVDTVLKEILSSDDHLIKLDSDKSTWNEFEMCSTVDQLTNTLDTRAERTAPIFFYAQPLNVHMAARNNLPTSVAAHWSRPGFNQKIAFKVHQTDECVGKFISALKTRGMYDNSVIVLTSDHGDATGEFGRKMHSSIIYPEVMRVPLIIHLPKSMQGKFVADHDSISTLTDITPSLYYLLGHGHVLENPIFGHPLFARTRQELDGYERSEVFFASDQVAVYGLLENGRYMYATYDSPARSFLFDLAHDPNAEHNILNAEEKKKYDERIIDYLKMIADFYGYKPGINSLLAAKR